MQSRTGVLEPFSALLPPSGQLWGRGFTLGSFGRDKARDSDIPHRAPVILEAFTSPPESASGTPVFLCKGIRDSRDDDLEQSNDEVGLPGYYDI